MGFAASTTGAFDSATLGGVVVRSSTLRSTSLRFAAPSPGYAMVLGARARQRVSAANDSHEQVPDKKEFLTRLREVVKLLKQEARRNAFTCTLLIVSLAIAGISYWKAPYSEYAAQAIGICEKADKCYKFACHFVPIVLAFWSCFK